MQSVQPLCSKGNLDQQAGKALIPRVVLNLRNPIHSLYTWPTMVSDIGKPLKLPQTSTTPSTFLTPPKHKKRALFPSLCAVLQPIFKQIRTTKVWGNIKQSFGEISESSEVSGQSEVWGRRLLGWIHLNPSGARICRGFALAPNANPLNTPLANW